MKIKSLLIIAFATASFTVSQAQITTQKIDSLMEKSMKEFGVVGASIAVIKDGKIFYTKGYGVKKINTKEAVNAQTDFQIGSNSKAFTTAALSILVDKGKINWQDKVIKYIPEFKMYNDYVTQNFTIEDLLTHRSGLGLGAGDLMEFPQGSDFTMKYILTNFQYFQPESAFRTKWDYDNQLYLVAGELIKRVSGITWEEFVNSKILLPLKMKNSYPNNSYIKDFSNIAQPHIVNNKEKKAIDLYNGFGSGINGAAGAIFSNAEDMAKWMLLQINGGKYGDKLDQTLFTKDRQNDMWRIHTPLKNYYDERYKTHFSGYGLGYFLSDKNGNFVVEHSGAVDGMLSLVSIIPDKKFGIVVLTNTQDGGGCLIYAIAESLSDEILGVSKKDYIAQYAKVYQDRLNGGNEVTDKVWKTVEANKNIKIKNEDFIGVYEDKWFGKCEIFMKGNQLWFKFNRSPKLNGPMKFYKANTFAISWEYRGFDADAFAMFTLDEEGKAQFIKLKGISPNIDFSFDFQDLDLKRIK